jgi:predicted Zn-dependent protease
MRKLLAVLFIALCIVAAVLGYIYGPKIQRTIQEKNPVLPSAEEQQEDAKKVKELLSASKPQEAMGIIKKYEGFITIQNETGKQWLDLLIQASTQSANIPQLVTLYEYFPSVFDNNEYASQLILNGLVTQGRSKEFEELRDKWKGRETKKEVWLVLDADKLIMDGKRPEAVALLKSQSYEGPADTNRLTRLALLTVNEDPRGAWEYFTEAVNKDPTNGTLRLYRSRMLEGIGKNALALSEYLSAIEIDPTNLNYRDQMAEFLRRHGQYADALEVWKQSMNDPSKDAIWVKAWFWSHIYTPSKIEWNASKVPEGFEKEYVKYLISLPEGQFWNASAFEKLQNGKTILSVDQTTLWLRVLEALKQGNEKEAAELLKFTPFKNTLWNAALARSLQQVIHYRQTGSLVLDDAIQAFNESDGNAVSEQDSNQFFKLIDNFAKKSDRESSKNVLPENLQALFNGPEAFSALFLAAGWMEAALQLNKLTVIPENYPEWISLKLTEALRFNRGYQAALDFATKQKQTPKLTLLLGELLISSGNVEAGLQKLEPLAKQNDELGKRAAWLIAVVAIEKKEIAKAREMINSQPLLANDVSGKELLARLALLEGNEAVAESIYAAIEQQSAEAKSFLARQAFTQKNWKRARELTEALLVEYPNNIYIRDNLQKIIDQEKSSGQEMTQPTQP